MKITSIKINNVLGARAVGVKLDKPVMLFAGKNFAGKSSIQEAVRMAMTGESIRVGLKKDYLSLVTEGQEAGFVQVDTDGTQYSVVLPAGKGVHSENHALPYVLDAQRFARMDDKERRTFLFGLMGIKLDGGSVTQRMLDKGLDAKKVEQIAPFLRAGFDAAQKEAAAKARDAKASWKTATGGETWGKDKAPKWQPAPLPADAEKAGARHENALARMKEVEQEIGAAQQALGAAKAKAQARQQMAAQRDELAERASRTDRIKAKLGRDEADVAEWQAKVDETRAKAGVAPVNPKVTGEFLLRGLASVTAEFVELTCNHPEVEWDSSLLNRAAAHLAEYRKLHGEPVVGDVPAQPDADAVAKLPEYEKALSLVQSAVANDKRDLAAAEQAAAKLKELDEEAAEIIDLEPLQAKVAELTEKRDGWRADADKYRAVAEQAACRQAVIEHAAALHADVLAWTGIADALAPDGILGEILAEALGPINDRLEQSSQDAEWLHVHVEPDMSIFAAYPGLPPRPYALLSESEKWRADAMLAESISHLSTIKLLVLDRFDVLDLKGREDLIAWLDVLAQNSEVETALIFGTLKALPTTLPQTIAACWLENGVAGQMKESA